VSLAATGPSALVDLARSRAEWRPWLGVIEAVREATGDTAWRLALPEAPADGDGRTPLLAGVTLTVEVRRLRRWFASLLERAAASGGPAGTLADVAHADTDRLAALLEAGLAQDAERLAALAQSVGADAGALQAVAAVAPIPLLRACGERWAARVPPTWNAGYCPVCGAWPILAEARGLERARRLRCVRCAADWATAWLRCPYCDTSDHHRLGALVPDATPQTRRVETCGVCRGYLKTITTLSPTPADDLAVLDLTTVELDLAAMTAGYARPARPACELTVKLVVEERSGWGVLRRRPRRRP
jgi:FdhE protein